jgi:hypothetical protein
MIMGTNLSNLLLQAKKNYDDLQNDKLTHANHAQRLRTYDKHNHKTSIMDEM